jgi:HEAT repeat protein
MVHEHFNGCLSCGKESGAPVEVCPTCGRVVALWRAMAPLWEMLERGGDEATTLAIAGALARIGGVAVAAELREWLTPRVAGAVTPGAVVALLGSLPDATARATATRIAQENFADKQLAGRWEQVLARIPTPEARQTLIAALAHEDETVRWTAIHAMIEEWPHVPAEAALLLRRLLDNPEETGEVQFCAATLLARMRDHEMGWECAAWLTDAIHDAEGMVADSMTEPSIAAAVLAELDDPEMAEEARQFLLRRLHAGSEAILVIALPALLRAPTREIVDALIDGCLSRKPRTPSAAAFVRAFREVRDPALRTYAWERLCGLLEDAGSAAAEGVATTLVQALGYLGCIEARSLVSRIATCAHDPLLLEAAGEALARLGDPMAIDACSDVLLADLPGSASDLERLQFEMRGAAMAEVLGSIGDPLGRARAVLPLVRALERPDLTRAAGDALAALAAWEPMPILLRGEERVDSVVVADVEETAPEVEVVAATEAGAPAAVMAVEPAIEEETFDATAMLIWMPEEEEEAELTPELVPAPRSEEGGGPASPIAVPTLASVVATLAGLERDLSLLDPAYFRYATLEPAALAEKDRLLLTLLCEELQPALDRLTVMREGPGWSACMSRAYYLKARLHHALTCDLLARTGADSLREKQRWDQMKQAERAYEQAVRFAEEEEVRVRALFDQGVLLAETERPETAALTFERVAAMSGSGPLAETAARYMERLRWAEEVEVDAGEVDPEAAEQCWSGALVVARKAMRAALWTSAGLAACGVIAWQSWQAAEPPAKPAAVARSPIVIARLEVTHSLAKVRSFRAYRAPKVKTTRRGERLRAIGHSPRWWKVQFANGVTGWIPRRYTREVD